MALTKKLMEKYLYTFKYHHEDQDLYQLEMKYLFHRPMGKERYFLSDTLIPMEDSSFGEAILEICTRDSDFEDFKKKLTVIPTLHDTKLDSLSLGFSPKVSFNDILKILPSMQIHANLVNPENVYLLTRTPDHWYLGKVVSSSEKHWPTHKKKPETISSAIPHILARTLVLALKEMGHKTLIDYCCGSGTFLIEACSLGLNCTGVDLNPNMTEMAKRNLSSFNYSAQLSNENSCHYSSKADCGIVDFPYGYHCQRNIDEEDLIIENVMSHVKTAAFICGEDFSEKFTSKNLIIRERLTIPAVNVTRYIYLVEND